MVNFDQSALFNYPALAGRARQAHSTYALEALQNLNDPFRTMKADQSQQAGTSEWSPFYQALDEAGVDNVRMDGITRPGRTRPPGRQASPSSNPLDALMLARYPGADGSGY